tara:strand:+ start:227 stop:988 length:762 start_codon:yes stop_codon:yes gene_type:complete
MANYNIFFSLNNSYFPYGKMLLRSIFNTVNLDKVNMIVVADTGLSDEDKEFINNLDKTFILDTELKTEFNKGGTWGEGWQQVVTTKTKFLLQALNKFKTDTLMLDADCIVVRDFYELLPKKQPIQLCHRGEENKQVPFLGSYIFVKNDTMSKNFLKQWINNIENSSSDRAKESPNLGKTYDSLSSEEKRKIVLVGRKYVSCYNIEEFKSMSPLPYIIHLKGGSLSKTINEDINKRIYGTHGFDKLVKLYLGDV